MKGKRVLFFDADRMVRRIANRAFHAAGADIDTAGNHIELDACLREHDFDLVILGCAPTCIDDPVWLGALDRIQTQRPETHILLHTSGTAQDFLPLLCQRPSLCHVIARHGDALQPSELIITAQKVFRRDIFGLDKYLDWWVEPRALRIEESANKQMYLDEVANYARRLGCSERTAEMIETLADELVTNAIYNAPRTSDGAPKYAMKSRTEPVVLEPHEAGILEFGCDGTFMALAQCDPFGALTRDTVVSYLQRGLGDGLRNVRNASGGAGIGLYRVFQSLSKLIVNIDPGHRTEVIALIDLRLGMKRFRQASKSLHIFVTDSAPDAMSATPSILLEQPAVNGTGARS